MQILNPPLAALDLTKQAPCSPRKRVGGFAVAGRAAEKCRASVAGTAGEYHYDSPLDNLLFNFKGITSEQFKAAVLSATSNDDVGAWLHANGVTRTPAEIKTWSDEMEAGSPMKNSERRDRFIQNCHRLGLNPEMNSTFDWLEADDRDTFSRKSRVLSPDFRQ